MSADERGQHQTFAEYRDATERCAAGLMANGIEPGSTIAWQFPTWIETLVLAAALARLDCIQVPLLPVYREREIEYAVRTTSASWLIVPDEFGGRDLGLQAEQAIHGIETRLLCTDGRKLPTAPTGTLGELRPTAEADDPVRWIFHSSGTTADPKGALHTDRTLLAGGRACAYSSRVRTADRIAVPFPVSHIGGLVLLCMALETGCANVLVERFEPEQAVDLFAREGVTLAGAGPAFLLGYLSIQRAHPDRRVLPDVRAFTSGGAPKSPALHAALRDEMGAGIVSSYGLTECPNATGNAPDAPDAKLANTEGLPNPGVELSVRAPDGSECPHGLVGELWLRGPQLCKGYVQPELNIEAFDANGFFRTGDLASVDEDGFLQVVGRLKDVIIRKGENISAKEVEDLLEAHPQVLEAAVIGLPDEELGELCCAVVAAVDAGDPPAFVAIVDHLRGRGLTTYKLPERLEVVTRLPRNASGKVLKRELRDRYGKST